MTIRTAITIALMAATLVLAAGSKESRQLNTEGYEHYKAREYVEAAAKFKAAVEADSGYAMAHYNLACTYGVLRRTHRMDFEVTTDRWSIMHHLAKACELDPGRLRKMKTDSDLDSIRDMYRYQLLLGLSPDKQADIARILVAVSWWGPQPAAAPNSSIDFRDDGTFELKVNSYFMMREEGPTGTFTGTYSVHTSQVVLMFDQAFGAKKRIVGEFKDGKVTFPGIPSPFSDFLDESPSL